jgi:hypothetical protein
VRRTDRTGPTRSGAWELKMAARRVIPPLDDFFVDDVGLFKAVVRMRLRRVVDLDGHRTPMFRGKQPVRQTGQRRKMRFGFVNDRANLDPRLHRRGRHGWGDVLVAPTARHDRHDQNDRQPDAAPHPSSLTRAIAQASDPPDRRGIRAGDDTVDLGRNRKAAEVGRRRGRAQAAARERGACNRERAQNAHVGSGQRRCGLS